MIVINSSTRQFNIPGSDLTFGVEADAGSERKYFQCPRYVGNKLDIASSFVRINYRNANGEIDSYLVEDLTVDGDNVLFSWELYPKVTAYKGQLKFVMCVTGPDTKVAWHTTLGTGMVLEGLEPDYAVIQAGTADVVAQLIALTERQSVTVENKGAEWVRNVQSEGTDQIVAVQTAGDESKAAAVAEIEAKGASTLATIPGEYTATVNAVQSAANAIRGKVSGEVIRVDDVSPMEHYPVVKVHGKNFFFSNKDFNGTLSGMSYSMAKNSSTITFTGKATMENALSFPDSFTLPKGNYIVSVVGLNVNSTGSDRVYLRNQTKGEVIVNHITPTTPRGFTLTEDTQIRTYIVFKDQSVYDNTPIFIQIEKGDTVTEYTPYIDPTTVTVTRCARNILPYPLLTTGGNFGGVTVTSENNTLILNGTVTKNTAIPLFIGNIRVKGKYTISGITGGSGASYYIQPYINGDTAGGTTDGPRTYDWDGVLTRLNLNVVTGTIFDNLRVSPMVEYSDATIGFEPYNGETQIPAADGTVIGLKAVSPIMSLLTDTPGVTIDCEYSRDTNKVIAEILEKITALGG